MVRVWYMDDDNKSDQRLEHQRNHPQFIDTNQLSDLTGVLYFKVIIFMMFVSKFN